MGQAGRLCQRHTVAGCYLSTVSERDVGMHVSEPAPVLLGLTTNVVRLQVPRRFIPGWIQ